MRKAKKMAIVTGGATGVAIYWLVLRRRREVRYQQRLEAIKRERDAETHALWVAFQDTMAKIRRGEYVVKGREQALTDFEFAVMALRSDIRFEE